MSALKQMTLGTKVIHAAQRPEPQTGAVVAPIFTSTTYAQASPGDHLGFEYTRSHNPTRYALERMVARLEGSTITEAQDPSCGGFAFASGMAAMSTALDLLDHGARIIAMDDLYGGSRRLLSNVRERAQGLEVVYVDLSDLEAFGQAMTAETRMIWVETPTNPMMKLVDLEALARVARQANPDVLLVCDNTFATPIVQRPFEHGFNMVMHSATKYLNGHSDVVGGLLVVDDLALAERLRFLQNSSGAIMSPFDAYLTLRGIKTLAVRMAKHNANGLRVARHLADHPQVEEVIYPGLPSSPSYALAQRQMDGFGGMVSFSIKGGIVAARRFMESVRIFHLAESLGAVESLVNHPVTMTHASVPPDVREQLGISDTLIRLSVGIEDEADLLADLDQALHESAGAASITRRLAAVHA